MRLEESPHADFDGGVGAAPRRVARCPTEIVSVHLAHRRRRRASLDPTCASSSDANTLAACAPSRRLSKPRTRTAGCLDRRRVPCVRTRISARRRRRDTITPPRSCCRRRRRTRSSSPSAARTCSRCPTPCFSGRPAASGSRIWPVHEDDTAVCRRCAQWLLGSTMCSTCAFRESRGVGEDRASARRPPLRPRSPLPLPAPSATARAIGTRRGAAVDWRSSCALRRARSADLKARDGLRHLERDGAAPALLARRRRSAPRRRTAEASMLASPEPRAGGSSGAAEGLAARGCCRRRRWSTRWRAPATWKLDAAAAASTVRSRWASERPWPPRRVHLTAGFNGS